MVSVRILGPSDGAVLANVALDVFDEAVQPGLVAEFLADPRHHLAVALSETGQVVGMATAVHYVHPDKPAQLFINEVGVSEGWRAQGIGKRLLQMLLNLGRQLNCTEAWVATEPDNTAAKALYTASGGIPGGKPFVMYTFPIQDTSNSLARNED